MRSTPGTLQAAPTTAPVVAPNAPAAIVPTAFVADQPVEAYTTDCYAAPAELARPAVPPTTV